MVTIENNKIKIEISTATPCEYLQNINKALIESIYCMDAEMIDKDTINPLLILLKELQPSWEQLKNDLWSHAIKNSCRLPN